MKQTIGWLVAILILAPGSVFGSDDESYLAYSHMLPEELLALPERVLYETVSPNLFEAARAGANSKLRPVTAIKLGNLMYPAAIDFEAAVKDFQADIGYEPTGDLTVGQLDELDYRSAMIKLERINLDAGLRYWHLGQVMRIQGSLRKVVGKMEYPINKVEIRCEQPFEYCTFQLIALRIPTKASSRREYAIDLKSRWSYRVLKWESENVLLERTTYSPCAVFHLDLNFKTRSFRETPFRKSEQCGQKEYEEAVLESNWGIVDGSRAQSEEFSKLKRKTTKFLAKKFRSKMADYLRQQ